ncbi:MAG: efflux RND transporter periplasmic adaptor subunit [Vicinamibacterales bacterium]
MTRALAAGVIIVVLAAAATAWRPGAAAGVPTAVAERSAFVDELTARGEIRPERSLMLSAPSSGGDLQIIDLVANGAEVAAGDPVVVFDATAQRRTLEQKESELKQALAELDKTRAEQQRRVQAAGAELVQARSTAARQRLDLDAADLMSEVDAAKAAIAVANADRVVAEMVEKVAGEGEAAAADVAIARQKVDKARSDLDDIRRVIESMTLRAPVDGTVSLLPNFRAGGPFSRTAPEFRRGDRAWFGAPIAELPDLGTVRMTLRVDEYDRARLRTGAPVRVRADAVPDRELAGRVREISVVATPDFSTFPPVRNFDVVVALDESDPRLRSGMSASARLELDRLDDVVVVPAGAVFDEGAGAVVYVVSGDGAERRSVVIERRGRDRVAVASGLEPGERVALTLPGSPKGGM